jgi:hypothetical protein
MEPEVDAFPRGLADDVASTLSTVARRSPPNAFANFGRSPEHADRRIENMPLRVDVSDIPWVKDAVAGERTLRLAEIKMIVSKTLKFPDRDPGPILEKVTVEIGSAGYHRILTAKTYAEAAEALNL